jgi:hypothetical protein
MRTEDFDTTRGGYGLRYFFNAGYDKKTNQCDAEGTDFYDEDEPDHYIGSVYGKTPSEIEEMTESEFYQLLEDNYII